MQATVTHDTTTRIITLEVSSVPDWDATRSWQARPRVIRPDHVTITIVDGQGHLVERAAGSGVTWELVLQISVLMLVATLCLAALGVGYQNRNKR